jgi:tight adherence protein B
MLEIISLAAIALAVALIVVIFRRQFVRQAALRLLGTDDRAADEPERPLGALRPFARRHYVLPWLAALALAALLALGLQLSWPFALAFGLLAGLLGTEADDVWLGMRHARIEAQLADAIALMVGAVNAGAGLQRALETALEESRAPLRPVLEEAVGRIRYGDDPTDVMAGMRARAPLETFRLFTTALAVNWQVGGSLAEILTNVERTIRDRIEINRRIAAMSAQVRVSVAGVLAVTYFIAALVWRNDPPRMVLFLASYWGQLFAAAGITLQGIGIVWISRMAKLRF